MRQASKSKACSPGSPASRRASDKRGMEAVRTSEGKGGSPENKTGVGMVEIERVSPTEPTRTVSEIEGRNGKTGLGKERYLDTIRETHTVYEV